MCNRAKALVKGSPTSGTLVSTKTKCIKLIFIGKIIFVPVAFLMALSIFGVHLKKVNILYLSSITGSKLFK